ncbi:YbfB/YjiJ family MFS transporter [Alteribacillus sp. HJP-4]|uniref:YbfB/YjiJ family MFS transporter n=1 Tax=Alteribacillus sp. HJP-4 TaxID=2775394 RepID=UPI0035CD0801
MSQSAGLKTPKQASIFFILLSGVIVLAVVMGIGRFAYTPILPVMVEHTSLNNESAGYLASSNYLGYLVGALLAGKLSWKRGRAFNVYIFFSMNAATTLGMGLTNLEWGWHALRFGSGLSSGIVFVLVSSLILDTLASRGRLPLSGYLFGGVGLGIISTGLLVPIVMQIAEWNGVWLSLGLLSFLLGGAVLNWVKDPPEQKIMPESTGTNHNSRIIPWLTAAYFMEGIGYIISGTYLVAFASEIPFLHSAPSLSWVFVGAAAAPSCVIWAAIASRIGNLPAIQFAFVVQIIGIALPVVFFNAVGALLGSILFGATFMGIVTMVMSEGRAAAGRESNRVISRLTFFYGAGQMIGPAAAAVIISISGVLSSSFYFAIVVLAAGMILLGIGQFRQQNKVNKSVRQVPF